MDISRIRLSSSSSALLDKPHNIGTFDEDRFIDKLEQAYNHKRSRFISRGPAAHLPPLPIRINFGSLPTGRSSEDERKEVIPNKDAELWVVKNPLYSDRGSIDILCVSNLAFTTPREAIEAINSVRSILRRLDGDIGFLNFLYHMGPFSSESLTSVDFGTSIKVLPSAYYRSETRNLTISYSLKVLRPPNRATGDLDPIRWDIVCVAIHHQIDVRDVKLLWLVIEDDCLASEKSIAARNSISHDSQDGAHLFWNSVHVNVGFCWMTTLRWGPVIDSLERTLFTLTYPGGFDKELTKSETIEPSTTQDRHSRLVRRLHETINVIGANITILRRLDKTYKTLATQSTLKQSRPESVEHTGFLEIVEDLEAQLERSHRLLANAHNVTATNQIVETSQDKEILEVLLRSTHLELDLVKLAYLSQNYSRGSAVLAIVFLPGIFVSTLLGTGIVDSKTRTSTYVTLWLAIAIPLTLFALSSLYWSWKAPILLDLMQQKLWFRRIVGILFPWLATRVREDTTT